MLGQRMHIKGVGGRTLPNPLPYLWDVKNFSPKRLLTACLREILHGVGSGTVGAGEMAEVVSSLEASSSAPGPQHQIPPGPDIGFLHTLHDAVNWCDNWLGVLDYESRQETLIVVRTHIETFWGSLLRSQEPLPDESPSFVNHFHPSFRHLDKLDLEDRERGLVKIYFDTVYKRPPGVTGPDDKPSPQPWDALFDQKPRTAQIWLVLMLRMVCWLNLHTFHAADVQLPKSDIMGSRLPVYIS